MRFKVAATFERVSAMRIGLRSVMRAEAYLRFVLAIVADDICERYKPEQTFPQ